MTVDYTPIKLRPGQAPQEGYEDWDTEDRMHRCLICGERKPDYNLVYKGYCFCQDHLPNGWERWDGISIKKKPFKKEERR